MKKKGTRTTSHSWDRWTNWTDATDFWIERGRWWFCRSVSLWTSWSCVRMGQGIG